LLLCKFKKLTEFHSWILEPVLTEAFLESNYWSGKNFSLFFLFFEKILFGEKFIGFGLTFIFFASIAWSKVYWKIFSVFLDKLKHFICWYFYLNHFINNRESTDRMLFENWLRKWWLALVLLNLLSFLNRLWGWSSLLHKILLIIFKFSAIISQQSTSNNYYSLFRIISLLISRWEQNKFISPNSSHTSVKFFYFSLTVFKYRNYKHHLW
jgi:hypothetical protein